MGQSYLAEVPEADATGSLAEAYADIRLVLGLPLVNLIYRHLAATPGLLERAWAALRPNLTSAAAQAAAAELAAAASPPGVAPIPAAALAVAGFAGEEAGLAGATLDAYARANSRNLLAMHALLDGHAGAPAPAGRSDPGQPSPSAPILPMADIRRLPPEAAALLEEMSLPLTGAEEPRIVPSLLRHFAHNPCLLALLWTALRPALAGAGVSERADALAHHANMLTRSRLPYPVPALTDEALRAVTRRFVGAMSHMLVAGEMLRHALADALRGPTPSRR